MLGFFRRKGNAAAKVIEEIYGEKPPVQSANLEDAIALAYNDLLFQRIPQAKVEYIAKSLFDSSIPFSTHDIAVSTALAFFEARNYAEALVECQLSARAQALEWLRAGNLAPNIAIEFENTLYSKYKIK